MKTKSKAEKSKIYNKDYFELGAQSVESNHFNRMLKVYRPLAHMLAKLNVHRALDVGCATGSLVKALLEKDVDAWGVDMSLHAINSSPIRSRLKWIDVEEEPLPFPNQYFDLVTSLETLEHLDNPERVISDISRVLKPSGFFFMTAPSYHDSNIKEHVSLLPYGAWSKMLLNCGLKPVPISKFRLFKLRIKMSMINLVVHSSIFGNVAKRYRLHKMGALGKILKFMHDLLRGLYFLCSKKGVTILAVKQ
jgi:ubiquinone/menaquinone biosynthesis C-methylase UbiE